MPIDDMLWWFSAVHVSDKFPSILREFPSKFVIIGYAHDGCPAVQVGRCARRRSAAPFLTPPQLHMQSITIHHVNTTNTIDFATITDTVHHVDSSSNHVSNTLLPSQMYGSIHTIAVLLSRLSRCSEGRSDAVLLV